MKKVLSSPKFWAITFGVVIGTAAYALFGDGAGLSNTFPMLVVGSYAAIGFAGKVEDIAGKLKGNGQASSN